VGKLDAVTFSGGEPLVQEGLFEAINDVKEMGFQIGLHTGGYRPEHLAKILPLVDWVGLDIKAPFISDHYKKIIGVDHLERVKQSLDLLIKSEIDFECRTTCDPRILSVDDIYEIATSLKDLGVKEYYLQKYRPIESDKTTTDDMCESIINDIKLLDFLKTSFEVFDVRK
jgi:pyruvate formate lyase activating enzyme